MSDILQIFLNMSLKFKHEKNLGVNMIKDSLYKSV